MIFVISIARAFVWYVFQLKLSTFTFSRTRSTSYEISFLAWRKQSHAVPKLHPFSTLDTLFYFLSLWTVLDDPYLVRFVFSRLFPPKLSYSQRSPQDTTRTDRREEGRQKLVYSLFSIHCSVSRFLFPHIILSLAHIFLLCISDWRCILRFFLSHSCQFTLSKVKFETLESHISSHNHTYRKVWILIRLIVFYQATLTQRDTSWGLSLATSCPRDFLTLSLSLSTQMGAMSRGATGRVFSGEEI